MALPKVTISGQDFIVNGQPYRFRGHVMKFTGLKPIEEWVDVLPSESNFQILADWKVNLIRVEVCMETAEPERGVWNSNFFDLLDDVLTMAEERNIYVLLCNMVYKVGRFFDPEGVNGIGVPAWIFTEAGHPVPATEDEAFEAMYTDTTIQGFIGEFLARLAQVGKDRNVVMGIDLFNEPEIRGIRATHFYEALSQYVTAVDPEKPQGVENNFIDNNVKPNIPNLFCAPHGYLGHTANYYNNLNQMKQEFQSGYFTQGQKWNVPTINAEWYIGTENVLQQYGLTESEVPIWYDTYIKAMEELGMSWANLSCEDIFPSHHWVSEVGNVIKTYYLLNEIVIDGGEIMANVIFDGELSGQAIPQSGIITVTKPDNIEAVIPVQTLDNLSFHAEQTFNFAGEYSAQVTFDSDGEYKSVSSPVVAFSIELKDRTVTLVVSVG